MPAQFDKYLLAGPWRGCAFVALGLGLALAIARDHVLVLPCWLKCASLVKHWCTQEVEVTLPFVAIFFPPYHPFTFERAASLLGFSAAFAHLS